MWMNLLLEQDGCELRAWRPCSRCKCFFTVRRRKVSWHHLNNFCSFQCWWAVKFCNPEKTRFLEPFGKGKKNFYIFAWGFAMSTCSSMCPVTSTTAPNISTIIRWRFKGYMLRPTNSENPSNRQILLNFSIANHGRFRSCLGSQYVNLAIFLRHNTWANRHDMVYLNTFPSCQGAARGRCAPLPWYDLTLNMLYSAEISCTRSLLYVHWS